MQFFKDISMSAFPITGRINMGKFEILILIINKANIMKLVGDIQCNNNKIEIKGNQVSFHLKLSGIEYHNKMLLLQKEFNNYSVIKNCFRPEQGNFIIKKNTDCFLFHKKWFNIMGLYISKI